MRQQKAKAGKELKTSMRRRKGVEATPSIEISAADVEVLRSTAKIGFIATKARAADRVHTAYVRWRKLMAAQEKGEFLYSILCSGSK